MTGILARFLLAAAIGPLIAACAGLSQRGLNVERGEAMVVVDHATETAHLPADAPKPTREGATELRYLGLLPDGRALLLETESTGVASAAPGVEPDLGAARRSVGRARGPGESLLLRRYLVTIEAARPTALRYSVRAAAGL